MVKATAAAVFLLMGALANAAALAGPDPDAFADPYPAALADPEPAPFPYPESASLFPRGNAEIVAKELGNITDFSVPITSEEVTGDPRGDDADVTDLSKDLVENEGVTPFAADAASPRAATDKLLFRDSMAQFLRAKAAKRPSNLIWTDDGCSKSPDRPSGFNFLDSCKRHDFGYRNYKRQNRFTASNRKRIDDNFKKDLYNMCSKYSGWQSYKGVICRRIADVYYTAVRKYGNL